MSCKVTDSLIHGVECDPLKYSGNEGKYVRTNPVKNGQDIKTYDHGTFQYALVNTPAAYANQVLGEIWVSYTVTLRKPRLFTGRGLAQDRELWVAQSGMTASNPMGSNQTMLAAQMNNIGCQLSNPGAGQVRLTFPASYTGQIRVTITVSGTGLIAFPAPTFSGNVTAWGDIYGGFAPALQTYAIVGTGNTNSFVISDLRIQSATGGIDNYATWVVGAATTITACSVEVKEENGGFSVSNAVSNIAWQNSTGAIVSF
jgi:hypothetical protein